MTNKELKAAIAAHKGLIYVGVLGNNDVYYVRAVKADLLVVVDTIADNELDASVVRGALYVDRAGARQ